ncbi:Tetratricopeptide repeat-containing protein [Candidatus Electrothrix gigas]
MDDEPNILNNSKLHLSSLTLEQINNALRAHPVTPDSKSFYRPLPCLTFALNWYLAQDNVLGYHIVNLAIHILTAWFLFLTLQLLLHIHYKKQYPPQFFTCAALLAALLWALAPIQTQAVTYIVQRMASMAAMFSIIAIYAYLRGRVASSKKNLLWYLLCILSFFVALGSKENAILLLPSLALLELSFFRHDIKRRQVINLIFSAISLLAVATFFIYYVLGHVPFNLIDSYDGRSFTFSERILTQPRIVLMYLSQIFLPVADRLSIEHDVILSTSLFTPWTTLPSILLVFFLVVGSFFYLKKYPIICFPILFFFLNHAVESTILPLELIFEHRNYIPSFFLFLPLGILVARILYSSPPQPLFRRIAVASCAILFLIVSGHATYTRNLAWATEGTLWTDVLRKAPNSSRAAHNLGKWYRQFGRYQQAYHYFKLALLNADKAATPKRTRKASLNGLASVTYMLGGYDQSLQYFNQCLKIDKNDEACLKNRMLAYLQLGQPEQALTDGVKLTEKYPVPVEYQYLTATAAYQANHKNVAINYVQRIVGRSLRNHQVMYLAGILMMKEHAYLNSLFFLQRAVHLAPNDINSQLTLATAYHAVNKLELTEKILHNIFRRNPLPVIINAVENAKKYNTENNAVGFIEEYIDSMIKTDMLAKKTHAKEARDRHSDLQ